MPSKMSAVDTIGHLDRTPSASACMSRRMTSFIMRDIPGQGATLEPTKSQLPATIQQAEVTSDVSAPNVVPALIADLGDQAGWR